MTKVRERLGSLAGLDFDQEERRGGEFVARILSSSLTTTFLLQECIYVRSRENWSTQSTCSNSWVNIVGMLQRLLPKPRRRRYPQILKAGRTKRTKGEEPKRAIIFF
jgi:hypothetical protein